nr:zinc ribbon domain-containing protein [Spirulina major]
MYLEIGRFFPSSHLCSNRLLPLEKMDLSVRSFVCPYCQERHDRDINAAIKIQTGRLADFGLRKWGFCSRTRCQTTGREAQVYPLRGCRG